MPILKNLQISCAAAAGDEDPSVDEDDSDDDDDEGPATESDELATATSRAVGESMVVFDLSEMGRREINGMKS